ncbi:SVP1-like protein 2 [Panaeolus papilionaceus]|nr:SVP1-like protein 2 [Panaeolus papilionaceus]
MNLGRHHISATSPLQIFDARFDPDCNIFTTATAAGFAVYRTCPLQLIRKREFSNGTLSIVQPMHSCNLVFLVGGGRSPLYPPNKVVVWNETLGREVAELEFRERVRGLACRRGWLCVALRWRVVAFQVGESISRFQEWDTFENPRGLLALATAPFSTLLAIPGHKIGHIQIIHLPPCALPALRGPPPSKPPQKPPPPSTKHPVSIIIAHNTALTAISVPPSGDLLATTSVQGTLVRVWDAMTGNPIKEFRRGTDKADIYGVAFRPDEQEVCVWSDKGTVHIFALVDSASTNRQSSLSPLKTYLRLPKYLRSEWSYAQYRIPVQSAHIALSSTSKPAGLDLPDEERCVVGWIQGPVEGDQDSNQAGTSSAAAHTEYQLVALTFTGGWYRLGIPKITKSGSSASKRTSSSGTAYSGSSVVTGRGEKSRDEGEKEKKESRNCTLLEYRKYGRWDGWG